MLPMVQMPVESSYDPTVTVLLTYVTPLGSSAVIAVFGLVVPVFAATIVKVTVSPGDGFVRLGVFVTDKSV
jgi:hypothetical protein